MDHSNHKCGCYNGEHAFTMASGRDITVPCDSSCESDEQDPRVHSPSSHPGKGIFRDRRS